MKKFFNYFFEGEKDRKQVSSISPKRSIIAKIITIILIIGCALIIKNLLSKNLINHINSEKIDNLKASIEDMGDLVAVEYNYTDILTYKDQLTLFNLNLPFTDKKYIIRYQGYIKAGVDLRKADIEYSGSVVKISLPEPRISDNVIDDSKVLILDEKNSIFNPISIKDYSDSLKKELKEREEKALSDGIIQKARKNTEEILRNIVKSLGFDKVIIEFRKTEVS